MIAGLLHAAAGAARGTLAGREDRRRRRLEDEQVERQNRISDAQIADYESRTRQRDELLGANRRAFDTHRTRHPDELGEYNPGIDYGRLELDEADEARRTRDAVAEKGRVEQERIDALVAAGMSPAVARARVVANYDPEAVASSRASRELMNESRRQSIADRAHKAVVEAAEGHADKLAAEGMGIPGVQSSLEQLYRGKLDAGTVAGIAARAVSGATRAKRSTSAIRLPGGVSIDPTTPTEPDALGLSDAEIDAMLMRGMSEDDILAEMKRRQGARVP